MSDLKTILQQNGVVGAGGAGFPSYGKLAEGASVLLINAIECEPLSYTDFVLVREKLYEIAAGMRVVMEQAAVPMGILAIKDYRARRLGLADGQELGTGITVKYAPGIYPAGDEINLIYTVTGRLVKPGCLPITEGVIVYNAETVYNIGRAAKEALPVTEKWLTVGGDVPQPACVKVPVGMKMEEVLKTVGAEIPDTHVLIDGGPSMGVIKSVSEPVTKTTKALLVLPKIVPAVVGKQRTVQENLRMAASVCCQCTRCTDMCPRHLLGYPLEPHKMVRATLSAAQETPALIKNASLCCSCGVCANFACCQDISPMQVIKEYKKILAQNKLRYTAEPNKTYQPHADREYRLLNAEKWETVLGVAKYDREPIYFPEKLSCKKVEIRMNQHIGAPSIPCVKAGDQVAENQEIAAPAGGLSVAQHASLAGKVTFADEKRIVIEAE